MQSVVPYKACHLGSTSRSSAGGWDNIMLRPPPLPQIVGQQYAVPCKYLPSGKVPGVARGDGGVGRAAAVGGVGGREG